MTQRALATFLLCSLTAAVAPMRAAHAEEPAGQSDGRAHFKRGVDFFKEGDYRAAMIEFKRAYELAPNYKVLYNLGQTSLELQDYASALRSFERYLLDGGKDIAAQRRAQVESEIEKLKRRVARVEVTTNVPDAEVFVDDVLVGRTPLAAPLAVSAGRRKISALKGGLMAMRLVDVVGGDSTTVALEIVDPTGATAAPALPSRSVEPSPPSTRATEMPRPQIVVVPSTAPAPPEPPRNTGLWIGITVTGALTAGAVATGIFALSAKKDFDNDIIRYGVDPNTISDARDKTRTLALVTDILAGAAIVSGGITLVAALASGTPSKETSQGFRVDVTPNGVLASGRF